MFPGERGLGRRIRPDADGPWHTVVGVAADVRNGQQVTDSPLPELYVIARRTTWGRVGRLALRTGAGPGDATTFLRQIVADLDPTLPITIETAEEQVSRLTAEPRSGGWYARVIFDV